MAVLIFFTVLSVIIIIHEFGHFIVARRCGVKVEIFSLGFGPVIIKKKIKETELRICLFLFGGYVKLAGDNRNEVKGKPWEYFSQPIFNRIKIIFSGSLLNYVSAFLFFWLVFLLGYPEVSTELSSTKIGGIMENSPAYEAGLMVNDEIVKVDGAETKIWTELQAAIWPKKGKPIEFVVKRGDELVRINITPRAEKIETPIGEEKEIGIIGVTPKEEVNFVKHNLIESFGLGFSKLLSLSAATYKSLFYIMIGKVSAKKAVTGPLGIFQITKDVASYGLNAIIHLMAVISMSLAIINLFPFPVLDGGHICLLIIEKIRGKPFSEKIEEKINQFGLGVISSIFIFITFNDFIRYGYWDKITKLFLGN